MSKMRIAISIDRELILEFDRLVAKQVFGSRSQAVQIALREMLSRGKRRRMVRECAKLNPKDEQAMAEEWLKGEFTEWTE